jgi:tetratricopeptide (TPR) repeat protein
MYEFNYEEAFVSANQIINEYPNSSVIYDAKITLAEIHLYKNLFPEARTQIQLLLFNPFIMNFKQRARAYYTLGTIYFKENDYQNATECFEKLFLDYINTSQASLALIMYFESLFKLNETQKIISKTQIYSKSFSNREDLSEINYQLARAYFFRNEISYSKQIIQDLNNSYKGLKGADKSIELEVLITEFEDGIEKAVEKAENVLKENPARRVEEKMLWMLAEYNVKLNRQKSAIDKLEQLINKFSLSDDIPRYYLEWMILLNDNAESKQILVRADEILDSLNNNDYYFEIIYQVARAYYSTQNYFVARSLLENSLKEITELNLQYKFQMLSADIFYLQNQFQSCLEIYKDLLKNIYSNSDVISEILLKTGEIYLIKFSQNFNANIYFNQVITISNNYEHIYKALLLLSYSHAELGNYKECLDALGQINFENIHSFERENVLRQIELISMFYLVENTNSLNKILNILAKDDVVDNLEYSKILSESQKQFDLALNTLVQQDNQTLLEKIKIYFLLALKGNLELDFNETNKYIKLLNTEKNLLKNISENELMLLNIISELCQNDFVVSSKKENVYNKIFDINFEDMKGIDLSNVLKIKLFNYYHKENSLEKMMLLADSTKSDNLVSKHYVDYINLTIANLLFEKKEYNSAIKYFQNVLHRLNLSSPISFYNYAMCLYNENEKNKALTILQSIVLNHNNDFIYNAKNIVLKEWILEIQKNPQLNTEKISAIIDILNKIPIHKRTDDDYRYFHLIYNVIGEKDKEKENLLKIYDKTIEDQIRIAELQFLTEEIYVSETSFTNILKIASLDIHKINIYSYLGNISFLNKKYNDAIKRYEALFKINYSNYEAKEFLIPIETSVKQMIISNYLEGNRPKAEANIKSYEKLYNKNQNIVLEIKLYEGIYYQKVDHKKAFKPLNTVIEDKNANQNLKAQAFYYRALAYLKDKKNDQVENDFLEALNSNNADHINLVRLALGSFYLSLEDYENSLVYYYQVIENDFNGQYAKDAANNFAITARLVQQWDIAISAYKIIIDRWGLASLSHETRLTISFCFYHAKQFDQAINLLNQLYEELTNNALKAETLYWMAEAYNGKQNIIEAEKMFSLIKERFPKEDKWVRISQFRIAENIYQSGDIERGLELFRNFIKIFGAGSDEGKEAVKYLNTNEE